jgi:serine protease
LCVSLLPQTKMAFAQSKIKTVPGEIVFKLTKDASKSEIKNNELFQLWLEKYKIRYELVTPVFRQIAPPTQKFNSLGIEYADLSRIYSVNIQQDEKIKNCIYDLFKTNLIEYAEPRYIPELLSVPNDPINGSQYALSLIQAYEAWDIEKGDSAVVIAIVDTGIDIDHEDLIYNIAYNQEDPIDGIDNDNDGFVDNFRGWDMGDNDNNPQNEMSDHGSLCAGLSAADTDNGLGVSGTAYHCKVLPIKVQDKDTLLTRAYEGIVYAANQGADVINCSWGNNQFSYFEQDIITYATINCDALVVAAAGNDNDIENFYPASYNYVMSVAATTSQDQKWTPGNTGTSGGSSFGYHIDVCAPGTGVWTTGDGSSYRSAAAGTSFASPIAAGVAGIVRSKYPQLSAIQALEHLKNTADSIYNIDYNLTWDGLLGAGRVNMLKAVTDEFKPGLVLQNIEILDDRENNYQSQIIEIHGDLFNFLSPASNIEIAASVVYGDAALITSTILIGNIDSLSSFSISGDMLQLQLLPGFAYDEKIVLRLDITSNNSSHIQYIEFYVNPSFSVISVGGMDLSVPANGRLGYVDYDRKSGFGLNYHEFRDLFYDAGWIIGKNPDELFDVVRVDGNFTMDIPSFDVDAVFADKQVSSSFLGVNPDEAINLKFNQNIYAWEDQPNLFLISMEIVNQNLVDISNLYAALFVDWDLFKYNRNEIKWDEISQTLYARHTGDVNLYAGLSMLSGQNSNYYGLDQLYNSDGILDMTNGLSAEEKYYCMTHSKLDVSHGTTGTDVSQIVTAGPVNIPALDTVNIVFGLMVSQSLYELQIAVDSAREYYQQIFPTESNVNILVNQGIEIYPNPIENIMKITIPANTDVDYIEIVDAYGKVMRTERIENKYVEVYLDLPVGYYTARFISPTGVISKKLIVLGK